MANMRAKPPVELNDVRPPYGGAYSESGLMKPAAVDAAAWCWRRTHAASIPE